MPHTPSILIVDDEESVRHSLKHILNDQPYSVYTASSGEEAMEYICGQGFDVVLLDIVMPKQDGLEALQQLQREGCRARVIVLTSFAEHDQIFPAIKSGAVGYQLKDSSPDQLLQAIRDVFQGQTSLHPTIATKVIEELNRESDLPPTEDPLTEREVEVLKLVALGYTNQEIAQRMVISQRTVGSHVSNILNKLHLADRTQAAVYAWREGVVRRDDEM